MAEKIANTVLISSSEHDDLLKQISTLRGQLQNCVNHLERAKRKVHALNVDAVIDSANRAIYESVRK